MADGYDPFIVERPIVRAVRNILPLARFIFPLRGQILTTDDPMLRNIWNEAMGSTYLSHFAHELFIGDCR
jgi:hypothetical protein